MATRTRRSPCTAVLVAAVPVLLAVALAGCWPGAPTPASRPGATALPETHSAQPTRSANGGGTGTPALPAATLREMEQIESEVIALRGLQPQAGVQRELLSTEGLRRTIQENFLEEYSQEEALIDSLVLTLLGLIPADFDLPEFYEALLNEQVVGFYDHETEELYVVQGRGFRGPERMAYAHEYTHVLQDQNYDLQEGLGYANERCDQDAEGCAALRALFEGDASFTELSWLLNHATQREELEVLRSYQEYSTPVLDSAPPYLRHDFTFPYNQGFEFVRRLYDRGGWQAVDRAYLDPPVSTEQILHPDRYPGDRPQAVDLPDLTQALGAGWELVEHGVLGEWHTYLVLAHGAEPAGRVNDAQASAAGEGWAGDRLHVYHQPERGQVALVLRTDWENPSEAQEFAAAFRQYSEGRFLDTHREDAGRLKWAGESLAGVFAWEGETSIWIMAPEEHQVAALVRELGW